MADMTPDEFEQLVADICNQLSKEDNATVSQKAKFPGKSGHDHEIDVAVEFLHMGVKLLVFVECKWWNKPVGIEQVMVLAQRIEDVGAHKGIIVTRKGFQHGAFKLARSRGIALAVYRELEKKVEFVLKRMAASDLGAVDPDQLISDFYEDNYSFYAMASENTMRHMPIPWMVRSLVEKQA